MSKRRKFSAAFKRRAVEQSRQPDVSHAQVARELGSGANLLTRWWRESDAVIENRRRKLESGLLIQEQYGRVSRPCGAETLVPVMAYLCMEQALDINGHTFHVERGHIRNYYYGVEMKALNKGVDCLFSTDEFVEEVPSTVMSEIARVAPSYEPEKEGALQQAANK